MAQLGLGVMFRWQGLIPGGGAILGMARSEMDEGFEDFTVDLFKRLLQCDTTNYGDGRGTEIEAVHIIRDIFMKEGIPYEIIETGENRVNIIGRLTCDGDTEEGPVLLSGHLDVVPADIEDGWEYPPFSGHEQDGVIYGRGAIDMKHVGLGRWR